VVGRLVSNHCALILKDINIDWGPKLFRCLDVWQKDLGFRDLIRAKWESYHIKGNDLYVVKEKLKRLKFELRCWNKIVYGDFNRKIGDLEKRIICLDERDDEGVLNVEVREERKRLLADLGKVRVKQEVIMQHKTRMNWLRQGDLNTKFYHNKIKWRRLQNGLNGIKVGDLWCEDLVEVKERVKDFF